MRIEHLYYLQEIVKKKSFSNAAEALHISQQSLSEAVAKIEKTFNFKIFKRSRNGAKLTDQGEMFMEDIDKLLFQYNFILNKYSLAPYEIKMQLSVCNNPVVSSLFPDQTIKLFRQAYPDIALSIIEESSPKQVFQKIIGLKADIGITSVAPSLYNHRNDMEKELNFEVLFLDYLCLLVRKDHHLAKRSSVSFKDFVHEQLIVDNKNSLKEDFLTYNGGGQYSADQFNIVMETASGEAYLKAVQGGIGVGFINKFQYAKLNMPELMAIPIRDCEPINFVIAYPKNLLNKKMVENFIEIFKQALTNTIVD